MIDPNFLGEAEDALVFHAVLPFGHILKCIAELLLRCAAQTPMVVDPARSVFFATG